MTWQTRTICEFFAASVPIEKAGDVNELLEQARKIGAPADDNADENGEKQPQSPNEPRTGSYESFMSTFGSPARWAGR